MTLRGLSRRVTKVHLRRLTMYDDGENYGPELSHAYVSSTYCGVYCYVRDSIHELEGTVWEKQVRAQYHRGPRRFFDLPRRAQCGNCRRLYLMNNSPPFAHREASDDMIISVEVGLFLLTDLFRDEGWFTLSPGHTAFGCRPPTRHAFMLL